MSKKIKISIISILSLFLFKVANAEMPKLKIIPRAGWGADEVLRYKNSEQVWLEEYAGIQKIIIHHTAGSTGADNPMNTVNAVYKWHARNLGWGDVGYNYLVDSLGNIYEGRYGGDGVIGAHAYDDSRVIGWNRGTIGISILGTYGGWMNESKAGYYLEHPETYPLTRVKNERLKDGKWQIYLEDGLTPEAEDSLTSLIAVKALDFGLEPIGTGIFNGKDLPNVVGHRDVDWTACPGDGLYNQLSSIRQHAQKKFEDIVSKGVKQQATLVGANKIQIALKKDEIKEIILQFRNDGELTWHNYTEDKVILADAGVKNKLAALDGLRMAAGTNEHESVNESTLITNQSYQLVEHNVKPGEIGTFKITLSYPQDKLIDERNLILAMRNKGWFSGTDIILTASAIDLSYKGEMWSHNLPVALFADAKGEAIVKYKNTGIKAWYKHTPDIPSSDGTGASPANIAGGQEGNKSEAGSEVYLKILDKTTGGKHKFYDESWEGELGLIKPEESEILPGNFAIFKFKYNTVDPGFYKTQFVLVRKAVELENSPELEIDGSGYNTVIRVDSPIQAELVEAKVPQAMLNTWTSKAEFKIKNTGIVPWDKNLILKVGNADENSEITFADRSWEKNGAAWRLKTKVMLGETAVITVKLKAPKKPGLHHPTFRFEFKGKPVYIGHSEKLIYSLRVDEAK